MVGNIMHIRRKEDNIRIYVFYIHRHISAIYKIYSVQNM